MKHVIILAAILFASLGFSQNSTNTLQAKVETMSINSLGVTITVDSMDELNEMVKPENILNLSDMAEGNQEISFKLKCHKLIGADSLKTFVNYTVEGTTKNIDQFLKLVEKTKISATNFYKN